MTILRLPRPLTRAHASESKVGSTNHSTPIRATSCPPLFAPTTTATSTYLLDAMPPRKSNVSTVSNEESPAPKSAPKPKDDEGLSVEVCAHSCPCAGRKANSLQDLNLPKSIVQRLAKGMLPANTQIQKDALLAMSKSATVFVNYITSWYVVGHRAIKTATFSSRLHIYKSDKGS